MKKENKNDSIQIIIYILAMVIILLLFILAYSFRVSASPMLDNTVSVNASITTLKKYVDNKVAQNGANDNVLIDLGESVTSGILEELLPSSLQPDGIASYIDTSEFIDAYENNDMSYFQATFGITYESDYDNLLPYLDTISDYIIDNVNNDVIAYYPHDDFDINAFLSYENIVPNDISKDIYDVLVRNDLKPVCVNREFYNWYAYSLSDVNDSNFDFDGFVFQGNSNAWSDFISDYSTIYSHGYTNLGQNFEFRLYVNGSPYYGYINHNRIGNLDGDPNLIFHSIFLDNNKPRYTVGFFSDDRTIPVLLFSSNSSFLKYHNNINNISILPYDFSKMFPNTDFSDIDFSKILAAIRENTGEISNSFEEVYIRLNEDISKGLQDILDSQKTTHELLLALLRYYDKNIVKDDKNITDILLDISSSVGVIRDNILFTDDDYDSLSDEVNDAFQNSQIKHKLENNFPFSVKRDFEHVLDYFNEDIIETNPRFVFNFDLFHDEVHDYVEFDVDLTQLPGINIFRSFFHAFIVVMFNFACFKLYDKFLTWYLS